MAEKLIYRSGVIPYIVEDGQIKMLFMKPSLAKYGGPAFQICKGKIEEGEDPLQAGLREGQEELGLFTGNILETYNLGTFLGRTTLHVVKIKDKNLFGDPHFETKEVKWMTNEEFQVEGRDLHKPVVSAAIRAIEQKIKQVNEIVVDYSITEHGVDLSAFNIDKAEVFFKIEDHPVYRCFEKHGGDRTVLLLKINGEIAAIVSYNKITIHGYTYNYLDRAFTFPNFRGKGYAIRMVVELHRRDHTKILSDEQMSPEGMKMWRKLTSILPVSAYDFVNNTKHNLDEIPLNTVFVKDNKDNKYLLLIEEPNMIAQGLTEQDNFNGCVKPHNLMKIEGDQILKNI